MVAATAPRTPPRRAKSDAATPAAASVPVSASGIALKVPAGWSDGGDALAVPGLADGAVTVGGPKGDDDRVRQGRRQRRELDPAARRPAHRRPARGHAGRPDRRRPGAALRRPSRSATRPARSSPSRPPRASRRSPASRPPRPARRSPPRCRSPRATAFPVGPRQGLLRRRRAHARPAREAGEVGGRRAQQGRQAHEPGRRDQQARLRLQRRRELARASSTSARPTRCSTRSSWPRSTTAGGAYKKAAGEGSRKDRAGYKREGSNALAARKDMTDALTGLSNAGYTLPASADQRRGGVHPPADADQGQGEAKATTSSPSTSTAPSQTHADADAAGDEHHAARDEHHAAGHEHQAARPRRRSPRPRSPAAAKARTN